MCLIKKHKLPKILPWKKHVYKIVLVKISKDLETFYCSPFYTNTKIIPYVPIKSKWPWNEGIFQNFIEGEGVHAYSNKKDAIKQCKNMEHGLSYSNSSYCKYVVLEAYIPRFTPYWTGTRGEIASSILVVTDKEVWV